MAKLKITYDYANGGGFTDVIPFDDSGVLPDADSGIFMVDGRWSGGSIPQSDTSLATESVDHRIASVHYAQNVLKLTLHADRIYVVDRIQAASSIKLEYEPSLGYSQVKAIKVLDVKKTRVAEKLSAFVVELKTRDVESRIDFYHDFETHTEYDKFATITEAEFSYKTILAPIFDSELIEVDSTSGNTLYKSVGGFIKKDFASLRFYFDEAAKKEFDLSRTVTPSGYILTYAGKTYTPQECMQVSSTKIDSMKNIWQVEVKVTYASRFTN